VGHAAMLLGAQVAVLTLAVGLVEDEEVRQVSATAAAIVLANRTRV